MSKYRHMPNVGPVLKQDIVDAIYISPFRRSGPKERKYSPMRCPGLYYPSWRRARINAMLDHYGREFFYGKRMLEVGCGDGTIGNFFYLLGCEVVCSDVRPEFLEEVKRRNEEIEVHRVDLNTEWPFEGHFDIILHLGVLYHLENPEFSIRKACDSCDHLVLDSELTIGGTGIHTLPEVAPTKFFSDEGNDHAFDGEQGDQTATGCRPSIGWIEQTFGDGGFTSEMYRQGTYDNHPFPIKLGWKDETTTGWVNGRRGLWFAKRENIDD